MRVLRILLFVAAALSAGCEKREEVRIGYFANLTHAQAVLGVALGDFAQSIAPAKFTTKVFNAGPSLIEALLAGEIDIGYVGPGPALTAHVVSKGQGIRVVAGAAANGVLIVARQDAKIDTMADLAGKRIATPQLGNTQDVAARHYVLQELKQKDASKVLPVPNSEQVGMMLRGEIDAAWAPEPWGSLLVATMRAQVVAAEKDVLWPQGSFATVLVVTTPQFLAAHPDVVEKCLRVHRTWTARLRDDPQAVLPQLNAALASLTGKSIPEAVLKPALANTQFTDDPLAYTLDVYGKWSYELNFLKQPPDVTGLIDTTLLRKLEAQTPTVAPTTAATQRDWPPG